VNYLALLGWSPGEGEEVVPLAEMARRFDISRVSHSAAVFDMDKLAWINRHYIKAAAPGRIASESMRFFLEAGYVMAARDSASMFVESLLPMAVGSVDRLAEIPARVAFLFDWNPAVAAQLVQNEPEGVRAVEAFAEAVEGKHLDDRDAFRAAVAVARDRSG